jgi:hypothetical protein
MGGGGSPWGDGVFGNGYQSRMNLPTSMGVSQMGPNGGIAGDIGSFVDHDAARGLGGGLTGIDTGGFNLGGGTQAPKDLYYDESPSKYMPAFGGDAAQPAPQVMPQSPAQPRRFGMNPRRNRR